MSLTDSSNLQGCRYSHLSEVDPSWSSVDHKQREVDLNAAKALALPIEKFRALGYRPPPLPEDVPVPGIDINIVINKIPTRDGAKIGLRIYKPTRPVTDALLFFNAHGGGIVPT